MKNHFIARSIMKRNTESVHQNELPSLQKLVIQTIADNFELYPTLEGVMNSMVIESILSLIDLNKISIITLAKFINNEEFWKRACRETFYFSENNMNIALRHVEYEVTYKQRFFELYFQKLIKNRDTNFEFFLSIAEVAGGYLKEFIIEDVASVLGDNVFEALAYMPNLCSLKITFINSGKDYSIEDEFTKGIDAVRAESIVSNGRFEKLTSLSLENNEMRAEELKIILNSLRRSKNLKELNLSHNKLNVEGAKILCKFFQSQPDIRVQKLNLSDNEMGYEGSVVMAEWMKKEESSIVDLSMKMNFINNFGLLKILELLLTNKRSQLRSLDLSSNLIKEDLGESLSSFALENTTLNELILDGNDIQLSPVYVQNLQLAFEGGCQLKDLSLKYNQIDPDILANFRSNF